jgi:hypothetical protein
MLSLVELLLLEGEEGSNPSGCVPTMGRRIKKLDPTNVQARGFRRAMVYIGSCGVPENT